MEFMSSSSSKDCSLTWDAPRICLWGTLIRCLRFSATLNNTSILLRYLLYYLSSRTGHNWIAFWYVRMTGLCEGTVFHGLVQLAVVLDSYGLQRMIMCFQNGWLFSIQRTVIDSHFFFLEWHYVVCWISVTARLITSDVLPDVMDAQNFYMYCNYHRDVLWLCAFENSRDCRRCDNNHLSTRRVCWVWDRSSTFRLVVKYVLYCVKFYVLESMNLITFRIRISHQFLSGYLSKRIKGGRNKWLMGVMCVWRFLSVVVLCVFAMQKMVGVSPFPWL